MSFDQNDTGIYLSPRPHNYENVRSFTNDAAEVEYDLDDSPTPSMTEEYVLPSPKSKANQMQQSKSKNPVIQDIYDEDHYTLARPDEHGDDTVMPNLQKNDENKDSDNTNEGRKGCYLTKKKMIILCVLATLLIVCVIGVVSYFTFFKKGMLKKQFIS